MLLPTFIGKIWGERFTFFKIPLSQNFSGEKSSCKKGLQNYILTISGKGVSEKILTNEVFPVNYEGYNQALSVLCSIKSH